MITLNENDYKYIIEDFSNYYIGARLSYQELADDENTPGRLKDAVYRTFFKEIAPSMTIGEHLLKLEDTSVCHMAFSQLRIRIKVTALIQKPDKKGNLKEVYETKDYSLDEFLKQKEIKENPEQYLIQEICFKKRHLMMMHV